MSDTTNRSTESTGAFTNRAASSDSRQLVTFKLANEEFAVEITTVHEINRMLELTRVPGSPPEVEGVINLRGKIIPVIDLRKRFGLPVGERNEQNRIVVVEVAKKVLGFIVDRVHQVLQISDEQIEPAPQMVCSIDSDFIEGVAKLEDRLLILLDLQKLFAADAARQAA